MPTVLTKWSLEFTDKANKEFLKLDTAIYRRMTNFIDNHLMQADNPRLLGKSLTGNLKEYWRYRIGDYRLLCEIHDHKLTIVAVRIAHRRDVYKNDHLLRLSS